MGRAAMTKPARKLKFEDALAQLDAIVEAMEAGEIGVEESIAKYEEAMALAAHCRKILEEAELRIQKIQLDAAGRSQVTPFEGTGPEAACGDEADAGAGASEG
jgi:exodeoxyribonuclease VII small subunit